MTTDTGGGTAAAGAGDFANRWKELRADGDIQFAPLKFPERPPPPRWWEEFLEWLGRLLEPAGDFLASIGELIGMSGQAVLWLLIGVAAILAALLVWRVVGDVRFRRAGAAEKPPEWTPGEGEALALLDDADRLAAEGRYDEATHLLLKRSVGQIAAARPGLLEPSSTAREISPPGTDAASQPAPSRSARIAELVRHSAAISSGDSSRKMFGCVCEWLPMRWPQLWRYRISPADRNVGAPMR